MIRSKKIVVLGHFGVGKTSLIRRFVTDTFSNNYKVTIGVHITKKVVEIAPNDSVSLILWDLEGTDDIATLRKSYLLGTHGVVYVFDITRPSTFQNLNVDLGILKEKIPEIPLLIVGNKFDLIDENQVKEVFEKNAIAYDFLTSAKSGVAVNEMFLQLATLLSTNA